MVTLYLASASPRRRELLTQLGLTFERIITDVEEQRQPHEAADVYVRRLAHDKAKAGTLIAQRDLRCWARIPLSCSMEKCWKNRTMPTMPAPCSVNSLEKPIRS